MNPKLNRTLSEIALQRGCSPDRFQTAFRGIAKGFGVSDEDYSEICKEFGRLPESEFKALGEDQQKELSKTFLKDRFLTFLASDETVDSYGDILRVDGADLSRYKSGAAAFITSHDMRDVSGSSGVIVKAWKVKNNPSSPDGKAIFVTVYFPTAEEDPDADYIFKKFKAGTLKAVSVGLSVIEYYDPEDPNERKRLGLGKWGIEVRKWAPYELSAVTVGANPNALVRGIDSDQIESIVRKVMSETQKGQKQDDTNTPEVKREVKLGEYLASNPIKIKIK